ncbi:MAG: hypothetical protein V4596_09645 [Bdellovibrionota bacterium]
MRKRNLSEFMCIEMLYDYKSGKLDPLRHQAVEEGLQSSPRVREELKKLSIGISYCDKLKNISVSEPLVDLILDQPKPTEKLFSKLKWNSFPQPVRWALEAVVVAVAIALFVTQVPNLFKGEETQPDSMLVKKFDIKPPGPEMVAETEISGKEETGEQIAVADVKLKAPIIASKEIPLLLKPSIEPIKPEDTKPTEVAAVAPQAPATTPVATAPVAKPAPKKGNAYVYRMTMYVEDVDTVTPEIATLISSLGGEKAGEVELGWRRKGGSYFHFSVPQNNSGTLQDGLKKYAPFNIVKSSHPRIMPEGIERYILWVEKKNIGGAAGAGSSGMEDSEEGGEGSTVPAEDSSQGPTPENN